MLTVPKSTWNVASGLELLTNFVVKLLFPSTQGSSNPFSSHSVNRSNISIQSLKFLMKTTAKKQRFFEKLPYQTPGKKRSQNKHKSLLAGYQHKGQPSITWLLNR